MVSADGGGVDGDIFRVPLRLDAQLRGEQTLRLVLRNVRPIHNIRNELRPERQREIATVDIPRFLLVNNEQIVALLRHRNIRILAQLDIPLRP